MSSGGDGRQPDFDALLTALNVAQSLTVEFASDPLVARVLRVLARIPSADREVILGVLERDATWCRVVDQIGDSTGITVRPNPHASLYVHVLAGADPPSEPMRRDIDVIRSGIERFVYLAPFLLQDGVRAQWTASARELAREASPELRAAVAALAREALALVAEAEGEGAAPVAPGTAVKVRGETG